MVRAVYGRRLKSCAMKPQIGSGRGGAPAPTEIAPARYPTAPHGRKSSVRRFRLCWYPLREYYIVEGFLQGHNTLKHYETGEF